MKGKKTGGRKKIVGNCKIEGCTRELDSLGLCGLHYRRQYYHGRLHKVRLGKSSHPNNQAWWDRQPNLPPEWKNDFWQFVKDVGVRPSEHHYLVKLDRSKPYSKDNFKWIEHIKRQPNESEKDWQARKWQQRLKLKPSLKEYGVLFRQLLRDCSISLDEYSKLYLEKSSAQKELCAICGCPETQFNHRSKKTARLALDHCHKTMKIRDLLCSRCNRALGILRESEAIITAMIRYIEKYLAHPTGELYEARYSRSIGYTRKRENAPHCEICGEQETRRHKNGTLHLLSVDHCHATMQIRGLLCSRCNTTLGRMEESIPYLRSMIAYLKKHQ